MVHVGLLISIGLNGNVTDDELVELTAPDEMIVPDALTTHVIPETRFELSRAVVWFVSPPSVNVVGNE